MNSLAKWFAIVVIFMELGGAKSRGGGKNHKGWGEIFMGAGVGASRHHTLATLPELYLLILLFRISFIYSLLGPASCSLE